MFKPDAPDFTPAGTGTHFYALSLYKQTRTSIPTVAIGLNLEGSMIYDLRVVLSGSPFIVAQEFTPISLPTADAATYVGEDSEPAENKEDLALADSNMVAGIYYQPPVLAGPHPQTVLDENGFIVPHPDPYALEPGPLPPVSLISSKILFPSMFSLIYICTGCLPLNTRWRPTDVPCTRLPFLMRYAVIN